VEADNIVVSSENAVDVLMARHSVERTTSGVPKWLSDVFSAMTYLHTIGELVERSGAVIQSVDRLVQ
jgi:hypothetical protein